MTLATTSYFTLPHIRGEFPQPRGVELELVAGANKDQLIKRIKALIDG